MSCSVPEVVVKRAARCSPMRLAAADTDEIRGAKRKERILAIAGASGRPAATPLRRGSWANPSFAGNREPQRANRPPEQDPLHPMG